MRRIGVDGTHFGIAVLDAPDDFSALGIQCHQRAVRLLQQHFAIGIGQTAIHGVAAHLRNHSAVLSGLEFPFDLLGCHINGKHFVGEGRMQIHGVTDHEWRAFMPAQHTG